MEESTIALFCCLHDFSRMFLDWEHHKLIPSDRQRRRAGILSLAEMLLIMVLLDSSSYKTFKAFWFYGLQNKYRPYFNELPSYERFVALMPRLLLPPLTCWCIGLVVSRVASTLWIAPSWPSVITHEVDT